MIGRFISRAAVFMLSLFAFAVMFLFGAVQEATAAARPFRIYMITWREMTDVERGFQNYMAEKNIPVEYIMRHANKDPSKLAGFVEEIRRLKPDLVFTWGTTVTLGVVGRYDDKNKAKYIRDIPVVFGLVADPVGVKIVPDLASSKSNVTGVYHMASAEAIITGINSYRRFSKLGMLYNGLEMNSVAYAGDIRKLSTKMGFKLFERKFRIGADGKPSPEGVIDLLRDLKRSGAEWLLLGPDSYSTSIGDILGPALREVGLPVFATTEGNMFPSGVLAGLISKYYSVGQFSAYKAEQILVQKQPAAAVPVETLKRFSYIIRMEVAKELKFYPPVSMFNYAEIL